MKIIKNCYWSLGKRGINPTKYFGLDLLDEWAVEPINYTDDLKSLLTAVTDLKNKNIVDKMIVPDSVKPLVARSLKS